MAAHSFWGVRVWPRIGAGGGVAIAELQMRATAGGASLCTGGTALGASNFGLVAANAFDALTSTYWYNGSVVPPNVVLGYEFASPVGVAEMWVRLPGAAATHTGQVFGPGACQPVYSDDGTTWHTALGTAELGALGNDGELAWPVVDAPVQFSSGGFAPRLAGRAWSSPLAHLRAGALWASHDPFYAGPYRIAGTVAVDGSPITPVARRVSLLDARSLHLVRQTWSAPVTGAYAFEGLAAQPYLALAQDHTQLYDPVARDHVVPVP